ncbi:deoxyhypusine synthase family protein [Candidatus Woesearchaeota archaeon]|nr:deoxyhypusine synthase family protein [Candidatus Woesearchaeota archaeon]
MDKKHYNEKLYNIRKPVDLSKFPEIKGYDFEKGVDFNELVQSLSTSGIQAANLGSAISIVNIMIRENVPVFLSFTANMISSGMRDIIAYLAKNNKISVLCTSGGGIEEDAIKSHLPFRVGDFNAKGEPLLDAGVGRIGNIFTTYEHYAYFEFFIREVFEELLKDGKPITPSRICWMMGKLIGEKKEYNEKNSYLYWAYKNNIPVYSPGIIDGAIGDIAYYFRKIHPEFIIDPVADHVKLVDYVLNCEKTAGIILGGGISKHYMLNAQIFREGFDYSIYISTAAEHDASDSGGNQEEAITWAKIKPNAPRVKVHCEASIAFPILVAATFAKR